MIGDISNKSEPPRRFVQTFVLAEQRNGYYVLNDIIRYLVEDEEELVAEETQAEGAEEVSVVGVAAEKQPESTHAGVERQADTEAAAQEVDEKLEEATTNGDAKTAGDDKADEATEGQATANQAPVPVIPATADAVQPEKPKEPEPTPVAQGSPSKTTGASTPADKENVPPKAAPKSWASIASVASGRPASSAPVPTPAPAAGTTAPQAPQQKAPAPQQPAAAPAAGATSPPGSRLLLLLWARRRSTVPFLRPTRPTLFRDIRRSGSSFLGGLGGGCLSGFLLVDLLSLWCGLILRLSLSWCLGGTFTIGSGGSGNIVITLTLVTNRFGTFWRGICISWFQLLLGLARSRVRFGMCVCRDSLRSRGFAIGLLRWLFCTGNIFVGRLGGDGRSRGYKAY